MFYVQIVPHFTRPLTVFLKVFFSKRNVSFFQKRNKFTKKTLLKFVIKYYFRILEDEARNNERDVLQAAKALSLVASRYMKYFPQIMFVYMSMFNAILK